MVEDPSLIQAAQIAANNRQKFFALRELNLPTDHYAITGSGALGIRNLREIGDIDIIVTLELWNTLAEQYGTVKDQGVIKIVFPNGIVEALREGSFYTDKADGVTPTISERIARAEIIDGLPFELLEHVLFFKRKMGRKKDLKDILLIEKILQERPSSEILD